MTARLHQHRPRDPGRPPPPPSRPLPPPPRRLAPAAGGEPPPAAAHPAAAGAPPPAGRPAGGRGGGRGGGAGRARPPPLSFRSLRPSPLPPPFVAACPPPAVPAAAPPGGVGAGAPCVPAPSARGFPPRRRRAAPPPGPARWWRRWAAAMAMFVLVVDTSLMNVSISAVVEDLDTTVSGVQSAIALEALVSAAFILISSKIGDLIGRKRAYVLGLLGYAIGAMAMTLAQNLRAIIIFWAILGGLGASLLLPAMQSLIHGNFEGAAQKRVYALVGAAAAIAAASGRCSAASSPRTCRGGSASCSRPWSSPIVLSGIGLVRDVPYTGTRGSTSVGAVLSVLGMGGIVLGILVWQEGGESVGRSAGDRRGRPAVRWRTGSCGASAPASRRCSTPTCSSRRTSGSGSPSRCCSRSRSAGLMIALPIFLQMVLEYNALQAGLSLAPLSLSMFAMALLAGKKAGDRRPSTIIRRASPAAHDRRWRR